VGFPVEVLPELAVSAEKGVNQPKMHREVLQGLDGRPIILPLDLLPNLALTFL
jgi:hypothetical protein